MPAVRFLYTLFCNGDEPKFRFARECETFSVNNVLEGLLW